MERNASATILSRPVSYQDGPSGEGSLSFALVDHSASLTNGFTDHTDDNDSASGGLRKGLLNSSTMDGLSSKSKRSGKDNPH